MAALVKRISQHERFQPKKDVVPKDERLSIVDLNGNKVEAPTDPTRTVLLCLDYVDSDESKRLLDYVRHRVLRSDMNIVLVSELPDKVLSKDFDVVGDMNPFDVTEELRLLRRLRDKRTNELLEVAKTIQPSVASVILCLSHAERPILTIMQAIEIFKPDLVTVGKREIKTTMDRWLSTSSVSAHLLVHSPSPVLIVK